MTQQARGVAVAATKDVFTSMAISALIGTVIMGIVAVVFKVAGFNVVLTTNEIGLTVLTDVTSDDVVNISLWSVPVVVAAVAAVVTFIVAGASARFPISNGITRKSLVLGNGVAAILSSVVIAVIGTFVYTVMPRPEWLAEAEATWGGRGAIEIFAIIFLQFLGALLLGLLIGMSYHAFPWWIPTGILVLVLVVIPAPLAAIPGLEQWFNANQVLQGVVMTAVALLLLPDVARRVRAV